MGWQGSLNLTRLTCTGSSKWDGTTCWRNLPSEVRAWINARFDLCS